MGRFCFVLPLKMVKKGKLRGHPSLLFLFFFFKNSTPVVAEGFSSFFFRAGRFWRFWGLASFWAFGSGHGLPQWPHLRQGELAPCAFFCFSLAELFFGVCVCCLYVVYMVFLSICVFLFVCVVYMFAWFQREKLSHY